MRNAVSWLLSVVYVEPRQDHSQLAAELGIPRNRLND